MTTIPFRIYTISNEIVQIAMETLTLPLFSTTRETPILIPQQREVVPPKKPSYESNQHTVITSALGAIFPTQTEENKVTKTRRILGETARALSDEHIETIITQFQFLIDSWLDEFEHDIFGGMTLKEVVNEK